MNNFLIVFSLLVVVGIFVSGYRLRKQHLERQKFFNELFVMKFILDMNEKERKGLFNSDE